MSNTMYGGLLRTIGLYCALGASIVGGTFAEPVFVEQQRNPQASQTQPSQTRPSGLEETVDVYGNKQYQVNKQFRVRNPLTGEFLSNIDPQYLHLYNRANVLEIPKDSISMEIKKNENPLAVALVTDLSSSMIKYWQDVKEFVKELFEQLKPEDKLRLFTFSDEKGDNPAYKTKEEYEKAIIDGFIQAKYGHLSPEEREKLKPKSPKEAEIFYNANIDAAVKWFFFEKCKILPQGGGTLAYPTLYDAYRSFFDVSDQNLVCIVITDGVFLDKFIRQGLSFNPRSITDLLLVTDIVVSPTNSTEELPGTVHPLRGNLESTVHRILDGVRHTFTVSFHTSDKDLKKCRKLRINYDPPNDDVLYEVITLGCHFPEKEKLLKALGQIGPKDDKAMSYVLGNLLRYQNDAEVQKALTRLGKIGLSDKNKKKLNELLVKPD